MTGTFHKYTDSDCHQLLINLGSSSKTGVIPDVSLQQECLLPGVGCLKCCWGSCPSHQRGAALVWHRRMPCGALLRNPHGIPPWNKAVCSGSFADSKWPHCSSHDIKNKKKKAVSAWEATAILQPWFFLPGRCSAQACISFPPWLCVPAPDCSEMSKPSTSLCGTGDGWWGCLRLQCRM